MPRNLIPSLGYLKSDFPDRPDAGTTADPIVVGTDLYPSSTWYADVHALTFGQNLTWPSANYYDSTGGNEWYWTLIVNNEPCLNNDVSHTGAPDRSQPVNGTNFKVSQTNSQATLRVTQTYGDGADSNIPYLGINTLGSRTLTGNYGDGLIVDYKLQANFSTSLHGFQTYQFIVYITNGAGVTKSAACYLAPPASEAFLGYTAPWDLDWDWRFQGSVYYPGSHFRFFFPSYYNPRRGSGVPLVPTIDTSGNVYHLKFDLDDIISVIFPEDASSSTAIIGIEMSMKQVWSAVATGETLYTESIIRNVESYPKAVSGVAAIGDSTTWGYSDGVNPVGNNMCKVAQDTLASSYGITTTVYNLGRNGTTVRDLLGLSASSFPNTNGYLQTVLDSTDAVKLVFLNFGINEAYRNNATYTSDYTNIQFKADLTNVVNQLKAAGKRVIIQTPNKVRQDGASFDYWGVGRDWLATVESYAIAAREVAAASHVYLDDKWNNVVWNDPAAWPDYDAVHPTEATYGVLGVGMARMINTLSAAPTYSVVPRSASVNEGDSIYWDVNTTNVDYGTVLYWTNSGSTNAADFNDNSNNGTVTIGNNSGSFYKTVYSDQTTEGAETIVIQLRTGSVSGSVVATASSVTVNDTSLTPSDATLSALTISNGTLGPIFNSSITDYSAIVAYVTSSITVTPTRNEPHATITVNGSPVTSGTASSAISLSEGLNTITIVVTAADSTTKTYTVTVRRASASASTDATLSGLTISSSTLSPTFSSGTTSYTTNVTYSISSLSVTPTHNEIHSTITVNGDPVASGTFSNFIGLNVGSNTITIVVTAQDAVNIRTYTITVIRAEPPPSGDATLSALTISSGTLNPTFNSGTTAYTDSVTNDITSVTITPTRNEAHATITVNGNAVTSGSASGAVNLSVGSNAIPIVVTAQNGSIKTYTITITRAASSDATLSGLSISTGTLTPTFSSGTTSYSDTVANATSSVTVTPTRNEPNATITVNGIAVTSGTASDAINLEAGANAITIVVTAQDGTTKTYTITVSRAGSNVSTLASLSIPNITLSPTFSSGTLSYTDTVPNEISSITVIPTASESHAVITVNGSPVRSGSPSSVISLNVASNTITIIVTSQDGSTSHTYTVTITREISRDAKLSNLAISTNSLSPVFNPSITSYTAYAVFHDSVTVTSIHNEAHATITVNGSSVLSGAASSPINLNPGQNTIRIVVTAEDVTITKTYSIVVYKIDATDTIDLGTVRASNNQVINATASNLAPTQEGTSTYTFADGQLPEGLILDPNVGYIYGFIPYQPAYLLNFKMAIITTKTITSTGNNRLSEVKIFNLAVKGEVESSIEWITDSNLGSIETGITSELSVVARQILSNYSIKYTLKNGSLPPGLVLEQDGSISGKVNHNSTGTYTFTVSASDVYQLSVVDRTFTLRSIQTDSKKYTEVYFKPLFSKQKRENYREFTANEFTFDPKLLYRYFDPNFGVQHDIKMVLEFGIEVVPLIYYTQQALNYNFYKKRFYFGDLKKAIAKDSSGTIIYEIVYIDPVDDLVNNNGTSVSRAVEVNGINVVYPNSVDNMRTRLEAMSIANGSTIGVNEYNKPRFMRTPQAGDYKPPTYVRVIPICYALPGQGDRIISRIRLSGFDFKLLDFEVDRLIVQESLDSATAKYLILEGPAL